MKRLRWLIRLVWMLLSVVRMMACDPGVCTGMCAEEARLRATYGESDERIAQIIEARTDRGVPVWVALDSWDRPTFVGYDVASGSGYWTATVDYVYAVGGSCVSP